MTNHGSRVTRRRWLAAMVPALLVMTPIGAARGSDRPAATVTVHYDTVEDGEFAGGVAEIPDDGEPAPRGFPTARSTTIQDNGPTGNRIDVVVLGDGYTQSQLGKFAQDAENAMDGLFSITPYMDYRDAFNVHRVDVASNQSGVDNYPEVGVDKDTAFDGEFWCNGIGRLLCVNTAKARQAAQQAPAMDFMVVLVNTPEYGGAGYSDTLVVASGNVWLPFLMQHEGGHMFGALDDEYDNSDGATYGGSYQAINCSSSNANQLASQNQAWYRWLGYDNPGYNGLVDAWQGCGYYQYGLYRPTFDSIMRTTGTPAFNAPSIEALIVSLYGYFDPVDDPADPVADPTGVIDLPIVASPGTMTVEWAIDGMVVPGATGTSLDLGPLGVGDDATVVATVTDLTPWVRNAGDRSAFMVGTATYTTSLKCDGLDPTIVGTAAGEKIVGTGGPDVINGLGGDDTIIGLGKDDVICGGPGDDTIRGSSGNDRIFGGAGDDVILSGIGDDEAWGGDGDDRVFGERGFDMLFGEAGDDRLVAGPDGASMFGGNDRDTLLGGIHDDTMDGGPGVDYFFGSAGNDTMAGGGLNDVMRGNAGDDTIDGGGGNDTAWGGLGADTMTGGGGDDKLYGEGGPDVLVGGDGDDILGGGPGANTIDGGPGTDLCVPLAGSVACEV